MFVRNTESRSTFSGFSLWLSTFYWVPILVTIFLAGHKTRQLPEFELWVLSLICSLLFLANPQVSTKRWVWDLFGVEFVLFFIVLGPWTVSTLIRKWHSVWCSLWPRYDHVTLIQNMLHWLPIRYRTQCKLLLVTFKTLYDVHYDHAMTT